MRNNTPIEETMNGPRTKADFAAMKTACDASSVIVDAFLDRFLVAYAIQRERLDTLFAREIAPYRKAVKHLPEKWPFHGLPQYAAYRLFRFNGLAARYRSHAVMKTRNDEEMDFLASQVERPWVMSFFSVTQLSDPLFFEAVDVFTGGSHIIYSPGIGDILSKAGPVSMLFLLIGFNGRCWQTYGPMPYFQGIQAFDVLYLAKLVDPRVQRMEDIPAVIDAHPVPFMVLYVGANIPLVMHKEHLTVSCRSEVKNYDFDPGRFSSPAIIEHKQQVYRLTLPDSEGFPHYASCYYHEKKRHLIITALTEWGHGEMVRLLEECGHRVPVFMSVCATLGMLTILKDYYPFKVNDEVPYAKIFAQPPPSAENGKELAKINAAFAEVAEAFNAGGAIDARSLADRHGIDIETARQLIGVVSTAKPK